MDTQIDVESVIAQVLISVMLLQLGPGTRETSENPKTFQQNNRGCEPGSQSTQKGTSVT